MRETAAEALEQLGFEVVQAEDGEAALAAFSTRPHAFAVAVMDLVMPRLDGAEACLQLRARRPDLPIVVSTGYADAPIASRLQGCGALEFLPKPYGPEELAAALARAQRQAAPTAAHRTA